MAQKPGAQRSLGSDQPSSSPRSLASRASGPLPRLPELWTSGPVPSAHNPGPCESVHRLTFAFPVRTCLLQAASSKGPRPSAACPSFQAFPRSRPRSRPRRLCPRSGKPAAGPGAVRSPSCAWFPERQGPGACILPAPAPGAGPLRHLAGLSLRRGEAERERSVASGTRSPPRPSGPARFSARLPRPSRVSLTPAGLPPALGLPRPQRQGSPEEGREGARDSLSARDFLVFLVLTTLDAQTQKTPRVPSPWPNLLNRSALVRDPPSLAVEPACISPVQLGRGFLSPVYTCSSCANANVPGVQPKGQAPTSFSGRGRCQLWLQAAGRSASPFVRAEASRPGICSLRALRNSKPCATCPPTSVPPKGNSTGHSP
ncbi:uncharacterized protein [Canis lupus baileyi]|uniref:uncharacterized protein n=1 Tax=Canis lupus baileyi TaxID=143281 RepID=UPI003B97C05F